MIQAVQESGTLPRVHAYRCYLHRSGEQRSVQCRHPPYTGRRGKDLIQCGHGSHKRGSTEESELMQSGKQLDCKHAFGGWEECKGVAKRVLGGEGDDNRTNRITRHMCMTR